MKRFLLLTLAGVLLVSGSLVGCSSKTSTSSEETIKVATDATWAPFETVNEQTKQIQGFDIDLFNAVAAKEDFKIQFENVAFDPLLSRPLLSLPTDKKRCFSRTRISMPDK